MNNNIRKIFSFFAVIIFIISLILAWSVFDLANKSEELKQIEYQRYLMLEKAIELKESSDNLTKYARLYTFTADEKYKEIYYHILAIRNGEAKKPVPYDAIYWQISEPLRSQRHPLGAPSSLKSEMQKLPYTAYELSKLEEAESNSNELVKLEVAAFKVIDSLSMGSTKKIEAMKLSAINLLTSQQYFNAKESIMLPIDDFLSSLKKRTEEAAASQNKRIQALVDRIFTLLLAGFILLIVTAFFVQRRILSPIEFLTETIAAFKRGENVVNRKANYNDEIGLMTKQFFEMKGQLDTELLKINELAITDALTGINNRRHFYELSEAILKLSLRSKEPLSILLMDIDHFKAVNDNYGHVIGDEILIHLAKNVASKIRGSDVIGRYGGEEFVVLLPNTNIDDAAQIAEKIRQHIEDCPFDDGKLSIAITVSIGAAERKDEKLMRELTQKVDKALYDAKKGGRNRVVAVK